MKRYRRSYSSCGAPRFDDYREIEARFDSTGTCGHDIRKGQRIGYCRRGRPSYVQCPACWERWKAENAEADALEGGYMSCPW